MYAVYGKSSERTIGEYKYMYPILLVPFFFVQFLFQQNSLENMLLPCEIFAKITDSVNSLKQDSLRRKLVTLSQIDS